MTVAQPSSMAMAHELDVRPLAPKHRADAILGAYASLARGATLRLTVDHDPECMYYTLLATEPKGSFAFDYLERGPVVWRVEVTKRGEPS